MDRAHTPALDRRLLVDRPYEALFFPRGLERIETSEDCKHCHTGHMFVRCVLKTLHQCSSEISLLNERCYFSKTCINLIHYFAKFSSTLGAHINIVITGQYYFVITIFIVQDLVNGVGNVVVARSWFCIQKGQQGSQGIQGSFVLKFATNA
ncbi:hypothetical protein CDAR_566551 [Caerostris darwini]|uniref:Uncharacterized protein n=1 Tax=Caerostris darwini TaxID=1538125 RepID=A0AAV4X331_9ARAC|nr:hypothetical protein CDAR_566551 [Caerostris darwini]